MIIQTKYILPLLLLAFSLTALPSCVRNTWKEKDQSQTQQLLSQAMADPYTGESNPLYIRFLTEQTVPHLQSSYQEVVAGRLVSIDKQKAVIQLCNGYPLTFGAPQAIISPRNEGQTSFPGLPRFTERVRWGQCIEAKGEPHSVPLASVQRAWISEVNIPVSILMSVGGTAMAYVGAVVVFVIGLIILIALYSCPMVYMVAENGDVALIGEAFTGAVGEQLERTDMLPLPETKDQEVNLLIANESKEIEFIDLARLVLVDADPAFRAVPTHTAALALVGKDRPPRAVYDLFGEQRPELLHSDGQTWSMDLSAAANEEEQVTREWLVAEFDAEGKDHALLLKLRNTHWSNIVAGEIYRAQGGQLDNLMKRAGKSKGEKLLMFRKEAGFDLLVEIETNGHWQEVATVPSMGAAEFREVVIPLPDADQHKYRFSGGVGFWELDQIAMVKNLGVPPLKRLSPVSALLGDTDVSDLLRDSDGDRAVQKEGQETTLHFTLPTQATGTNRSMFLETRGYYEPLTLEESHLNPLLLARLQMDPAFVGELSLSLYNDFLVGMQYVLASYVE
jgi:hypothetical protein